MPKYAIVMTDGNSNIDKPMTVEEAVKCKLAGIRCLGGWIYGGMEWRLEGGDG